MCITNTPRQVSSQCFYTHTQYFLILFTLYHHCPSHSSDTPPLSLPNQPHFYFQVFKYIFKQANGHPFDKASGLQYISPLRRIEAKEQRPCFVQQPQARQNVLNLLLSYPEAHAWALSSASVSRIKSFPHVIVFVPGGCRAEISVVRILSFLL